MRNGRRRTTRRQKHSIRPRKRARGPKASDILDDIRHCLFEHQIELQILNAEKNLNRSEVSVLCISLLFWFMATAAVERISQLQQLSTTSK